MTTVFLTPAAVLFLHDRLIRDFGGAPGVRAEAALAAALSRPRATFDRRELYPGLFEKAAALLESLCQDHPFVDGNKRVAYSAAGLFLQQNGWTLRAGEEAVAFMLAVASGKFGKEQIRIWIENHAVPYSVPRGSSKK